MQYKGKLYGKVGNSYIPLESTTEDYDYLERQLAYAKEALNAALESQPKWISVEKQLPQTLSEDDNLSVPVITFLGADCEIALYKYDTKQWFDTWGNKIGVVTHWQYLPPKP
jgi:uncharacterized protein YllA (UPF0747 family)